LIKEDHFRFAHEDEALSSLGVIDHCVSSGLSHRDLVRTTRVHPSVADPHPRGYPTIHLSKSVLLIFIRRRHLRVRCVFIFPQPELFESRSGRRILASVFSLSTGVANFFIRVDRVDFSRLKRADCPPMPDLFYRLKAARTSPGVFGFVWCCKEQRAAESPYMPQFKHHSDDVNRLVGYQPNGGEYRRRSARRQGAALKFNSHRRGDLRFTPQSGPGSPAGVNFPRAWPSPLGRVAM
jgi:hypothetical protein